MSGPGPGLGPGRGDGAPSAPPALRPLQPKLLFSLTLRPKLQQLGRVSPDHNLRKVKMASSSTNRAFEEAWEEILPRGLYRAVQFTAVDLEIERTEEKFDFFFKLATGLIWATTWTSIIKVE